MKAPSRQSPPRGRKQRPGPLSWVAAIVLVGLLLLPIWAGVQLARSFDPRFLAGYFVFISGLTFGLCWHDKRQAQTDGWRTPEATLHLSELFGGWPASFLAQRLFRHKISKLSYQAEFWGIVVLHEAAAFDYLNDWKYLSAVFSLLK